MSEQACHHWTGDHWEFHLPDHPGNDHDWANGTEGYCPTCGTGLRADGSEQARVDADAGTVRVAEGELRALIEFVSDMGCPETGCDGCPACPCYPTHKSCRAALLARFGLEVRDEQA